MSFTLKIVERNQIQAAPRRRLGPSLALFATGFCGMAAGDAVIDNGWFRNMLINNAVDLGRAMIRMVLTMLGQY
jgi:hypothetical protein